MTEAEGRKKAKLPFVHRDRIPMIGQLSMQPRPGLPTAAIFVICHPTRLGLRSMIVNIKFRSTCDTVARQFPRAGRLTGEQCGTCDSS
jgi:hypothetical protein